MPEHTDTTPRPPGYPFTAESRREHQRNIAREGLRTMHPDAADTPLRIVETPVPTVDIGKGLRDAIALAVSEVNTAISDAERYGRIDPAEIVGVNAILHALDVGVHQLATRISDEDTGKQDAQEHRIEQATERAIEAAYVVFANALGPVELAFDHNGINDETDESLRNVLRLAAQQWDVAAYMTKSARALAEEVPA